MVSGLSREEKTDLLKDLATIPIVCENVARSQSKLRSNRDYPKGAIWRSKALGWRAIQVIPKSLNTAD
jgi:hypothetical protein